MSDNASSTAMVGTTLAVTQTISLFTVLMPPITDVHRHNPEADHPFASDVRQAEFVAGGLSLSVAAIMSRIEGSWLPFVAASFLVAVLIGAYEYTLNKPGFTPNLSAVSDSRSNA